MTRALGTPHLGHTTTPELVRFAILLLAGIAPPTNFDARAGKKDSALPQSVQQVSHIGRKRGLETQSFARLRVPKREARGVKRLPWERDWTERFRTEHVTLFPHERVAPQPCL